MKFTCLTPTEKVMVWTGPVAVKTRRLKKEGKESEKGFDPQPLLLWFARVFWNTHQSSYFHIHWTRAKFSIPGWCHPQTAGFLIPHLLVQRLWPTCSSLWEHPSYFCCSLECDAWKKGLHLLPVKSPWRQSLFLLLLTHLFKEDTWEGAECREGTQLHTQRFLFPILLAKHSNERLPPLQGPIQIQRHAASSNPWLLIVRRVWYRIWTANAMELNLCHGVQAYRYLGDPCVCDSLWP